MIISHIEGCLADEDMKIILKTLYSNVSFSITKSPTIILRGDSHNVKEFMKYVDTVDDIYFIKLGIEKPVFIGGNNSNSVNKSFIIDNSDMQDQLDYVILHYV